MNKFVKVATTALVVSGLVMSSAAMAAPKRPKARPDVFSLPVNESLADNVLTNDVGDTLAAEAKTITTKYGEAEIAADGSVTFTPNSSAKAGKGVSFSYTIEDANGKKARSTVRIKFKAASVS